MSKKEIFIVESFPNDGYFLCFRSDQERDQQFISRVEMRECYLDLRIKNDQDFFNRIVEVCNYFIKKNSYTEFLDIKNTGETRYIRR